MKNIIVLVFLLFTLNEASAKSKMVTYTGTIKGYNTNIGYSTGKIYVSNVVTHLTDLYLIEIKPDGSFLASFPLDYNQECWINFPFFNSHVYFEPGKKIVQDFDITNANNISSIFQGNDQLALINNDINKVRPILLGWNWSAIYDDIYLFTPEQYKDYLSKIGARQLSAIDSVATTAGMDKRSYQLVKRYVQYQLAGYLLSYNYTRQNAYRTKNKLPFNDRNPVIPNVKLDVSYYNFLKEIKYNDPTAMSSFWYFGFLDQLKRIELITEQTDRIDYVKEIKSLKALDTLDKVLKANLAYFEDMARQNTPKPVPWEKATKLVLKQLLNTNVTLELELLYLQSISVQKDYDKDTLSDAEVDKLRSRTKHKFLLADIETLNSKLRKTIKDAKMQTGYVDNQIKKDAQADGVFADLIKKYEGKAVFVDFWATWCAPCLMSIKEMVPLKEEMAQNKDVVFLYITSPTSPEKSYQIVMPSIKGEHYRLTYDQYNVLAKQFNVTAIPHYALINKAGQVVDKDFKWVGIDEIKKQLVALANE